MWRVTLEVFTPTVHCLCLSDTPPAGVSPGAAAPNAWRPVSKRKLPHTQFNLISNWPPMHRPRSSHGPQAANLVDVPWPILHATDLVRHDRHTRRTRWGGGFHVANHNASIRGEGSWNGTLCDYPGDDAACPGTPVSYAWRRACRTTPPHRPHNLGPVFPHAPPRLRRGRAHNFEALATPTTGFGRDTVSLSYETRTM